MVSYNTLAAMKKAAGKAFAASPSIPVALEVTISWQAAARQAELMQQAASQAAGGGSMEEFSEEEKALNQHHHFRYATLKNNIVKPGTLMDYGVVGHIHTIEFRSEIPLIIGGVPLCSVFTPVHLGRFVPDGAEVHIEVLQENNLRSRASFIYSPTAPTHVGITINAQGTMAFSL